jgi:P-type conjugative transfer protein TrbJ
MIITSKTLRRLAIVTTALYVLKLGASPAEALTVFDPWNYKENLLTAIRELEQIQNQVKQLANEAQVLMNMDNELAGLDSSFSGDLTSQLGEIKSLIDKADGIALSVNETETAYKALFPATYEQALTSDQSLKAAETRWDETLAAFKRSMSVQAEVVEGNDEDSRQLSDLLSKSASAIGNLQVQQAGNELIGLNIKQGIELQTMMAAEARAQAFDRARALSSQEESRLRFKSFIGDGKAYTPEK